MQYFTISKIETDICVVHLDCLIPDVKIIKIPISESKDDK